MQAIETSKRLNQLMRTHGRKLKTVALTRKGDDLVFDENLVLDVIELPIDGEDWGKPVIAIMTKEIEEELNDQDLSEVTTIRDTICS